MHVKLLKAQLPQLIPWLKLHHPYTFKIYGELKSHLSGHYPDLEFFVDRWPHPQAVVVALDVNGKLGSMEYLRNLVQGVFGVTEESVKSLLTDPAVIDWDARKVLTCFSETVMTWIQSVAKQMGRNCSGTPNYLMKATSQDLKPIPVPEGMKLQPCSAADVGIINATWKFTNEGSDGYVQHTVEHYPSLSLKMDNGDHVGHMISNTYGLMGCLYVDPAYRRRGYAKVIVSHLAQKYFDVGEDVYVIVEEENARSFSLHRSLGFEKVPDVIPRWLCCMPENSCQVQGAKCCV